MVIKVDRQASSFDAKYGFVGHPAQFLCTTQMYVCALAVRSILWATTLQFLLRLESSDTHSSHTHTVP